MQTMVDPIRALLAEAFELPLEAITPDLAFGQVRQWDSMGHMGVMLKLEEQFGVEVSAETIGELTSIPAICNYLMERAA
jgi:acyl carrier protein